MVLAVSDTEATSAPKHALEEHYRRYRDRIFGWCMHFAAGDKHFAQDVTQDVFVRLCEQLPRLRAHDDLGGWLYRVTANLCKTRLKRRRSWLGRLAGMVTEQPTSLSRDLEAQGEAGEVLAVVRSFPPRERIAFCMKVLHGRTQKQIAADLGVSEALVCRWLSRSWQHIRDAGWEG